MREREIKKYILPKKQATPYPSNSLLAVSWKPGLLECSNLCQTVRGQFEAVRGQFEAIGGQFEAIGGQFETVRG